MKLVLVNGSPKAKGGASASLLEELRPMLPAGAELLEVGLHKPAIGPGDLEGLRLADVLVFACPLYVDGLPGHLLACLLELEKAQWKEGARAYGIVNCGFYEGGQAAHALQVLQHWCQRAGIAWGGGIGVGGGGALETLPPPANGRGPRGPVHQALETLAGGLQGKEGMGELYVTLAFPRFLYKLAGQMGWRQKLKANGGKGKDLGRRWP